MPSTNTTSSVTYPHIHETSYTPVTPLLSVDEQLKFPGNFTNSEAGVTVPGANVSQTTGVRLRFGACIDSRRPRPEIVAAVVVVGLGVVLFLRFAFKPAPVRKLGLGTLSLVALAVVPDTPREAFFW